MNPPAPVYPTVMKVLERGIGVSGGFWGPWEGFWGDSRDRDMV